LDRFRPLGGLVKVLEHVQSGKLAMDEHILTDLTG
jgi:hypothetical protein